MEPSDHAGNKYVSAFITVSAFMLLALIGLVLQGCSTSKSAEVDNVKRMTALDLPDAVVNGIDDIAQLSDSLVDFSNLESEFQKVISDYSDISSVAVTFRAIGNRVGGFSINGNKPMVAASMIKMVILSSLFDKIKNGDLSFGEVIEVQSADVVGGSGTGIKAGEEFTVKELANRMISESDNTASNTLISILGIDDINEHSKTMGYDQIRLDHKFMSTKYKYDNLVSSNDLADIFVAIAKGQLGSYEMSSMAEEFLYEQTDELGLKEGLASGYQLGHKTGIIDSVRNDGGIFYDPSGEPSFVLVVLTNGVDVDVANEMMSRLSLLACEEMAGV